MIHRLRIFIFCVTFLGMSYLALLGSTPSVANLEVAEPLEGSSTLVWPLQGGENINQSSPFGPRQKASEDYRYDFHRGIDLPTPVGTPLIAVEDGTVRLSGNYSYYTDQVIQIRHDNGAYYSNYIHVSKTYVVEGEEVTKGQVIGESGVSESGFPHLHFEIREGGIYSSNTTNPWKYLPYNDTVDAHQIRDINLTKAGETWNISVQTATPNTELDFNRVEVELRAQGVVVQVLVFDFVAFSSSINDISDLDDPVRDGLVITPHIFNARTPFAVWDLTFYAVPASTSVTSIVVNAYDIMGNKIEEQLDLDVPLSSSSLTSTNAGLATGDTDEATGWNWLLGLPVLVLLGTTKKRRDQRC